MSARFSLIPPKKKKLQTNFYSCVRTQERPPTPFFRPLFSLSPLGLDAAPQAGEKRGNNRCSVVGINSFSADRGALAAAWSQQLTQRPARKTPTLHRSTRDLAVNRDKRSLAGAREADYS